MIRFGLIVFVIASIFSSLFYPIAIEADRFLWNRLFDAGHLPLFFLASIVLYLALNQESGVRRVVLAGAISLLIAAVTELVQPYLNRSASWSDFLNSALGVILGVGGIYVWFISQKRIWRLVHIFLVFICSFFVLLPAWYAWSAIKFRTSEHPVLGTFERSLELLLWSPIGWSLGGKPSRILISQPFREGDSSSLQVSGNGRFVGVQFRSGKSDWSTLNLLKFDVYSAVDEFPFFLRIDDKLENATYQDRFNKQFSLSKGWNRLEISIREIQDGPLHRQLNLKNIRGVFFFTEGLEGKKSFNLDTVELQ